MCVSLLWSITWYETRTHFDLVGWRTEHQAARTCTSTVLNGHKFINKAGPLPMPLVLVASHPSPTLRDRSRFAVVGASLKNAGFAWLHPSPRLTLPRSQIIPAGLSSTSPMCFVHPSSTYYGTCSSHVTSVFHLHLSDHFIQINAATLKKRGRIHVHFLGFDAGHNQINMKAEYLL